MIVSARIFVGSGVLGSMGCCWSVAEALLGAAGAVLGRYLGAIGALLGRGWGVGVVPARCWGRLCCSWPLFTLALGPCSFYSSFLGGQTKQVPQKQDWLPKAGQII